LSKDTALLVVDVQNAVVDWSNTEARGQEVLSKINQLLSRARAALVPVIYVQHDGEPGHRLAVGSEGWRIHPAIAPFEGELVVRKRASDAFYQTPLQSALDERGIKRLVVVGCCTQYCVDTTCRSAVSHGYDVTLASDAHTTMGNSIIPSSQIVAHHNETLDQFGNDEHLVTIRRASEIEF
jgi:nicotinamidase-related amidase